MLTCKEVSTMIASDDLSRRPWRTRLGIRLHLMMCRHCRRYKAQLAAIADAVRGFYRSQSPPTDELEKTILESLRRR